MIDTVVTLEMFWLSRVVSGICYSEQSNITVTKDMKYWTTCV